MLHMIWLSRHTLIHTKVSCKVAFEELNNTRENTEEIVESVECLYLEIDRK